VLPDKNLFFGSSSAAPTAAPVNLLPAFAQLGLDSREEMASESQKFHATVIDKVSREPSTPHEKQQAEVAKETKKVVDVFLQRAQQTGYVLTKVSRKGKHHEREIKISTDGLRIEWARGVFAFGPAHFPLLTQIQDVHTYKEGSNNFMRLVFPSDALTLCSANESHITEWARVMRLVASDRGLMMKGESLFEKFLHSQWTLADVNFDNKLDVNEVLTLLKRLNIQGASKKLVKEKLEKLDSNKDGFFQFDEFRGLMKELMARKEINQIFFQHANVGERERNLWSILTFQKFLTETQGDVLLSPPSLVSLVASLQGVPGVQDLKAEGLALWLNHPENCIRSLNATANVYTPPSPNITTAFLR
jgi:hypothetical protein